VKLQLSAPSAATAPASVSSKMIVTVLWASATPERVGVAVFTRAPLAGVPTTGAAGAMESTVKVRGAEARPMFPAASVACAVTVWIPCPSEAPGMKLQEPELLTDTVPAVDPSSESVTVLPASAVPEMAGAVALTKAPLAGAMTTGAGGGTDFTVKERTAEAGPVLPAASVAWVVTV
jgi:hypothetical protein